MVLDLRNAISSWALGSPVRWGLHLPGPILDRELRVSSRRRRNYWIRVVYLAMPMLFLLGIWWETMRHVTSPVAYAAELARSGRAVTVLIVWFQFITCQVVAVAMLSTAITDEISRKTLGILMTTPITSLQIILGKLLGRLIQVVFLMALSMPVLAVVRVFGGVPWDFLAGGLVLTLATLLFSGSISLFFSIFCSRAHGVILWSAVVLGTLWGLPPLLADMAGMDYINDRLWLWLLFRANPFMAMGQLTLRTWSPMAPTVGAQGLWLWQGLSLLLGTVMVLTLSVIRVRTVAIRQITGNVQTPARLRKKDKAGAIQVPEVARRPIRPVKGCPVLWREIRVPLLGNRRWLILIGLTIVFGTLSCIYGAVGIAVLKSPGFHTLMVVAYMLLGSLAAAILSAMAITTEREARSWPILLATPMDDWRIVRAKGLGAIRRGLPVWGLLAAHVLGFAAAGIIHPLAAVQLTMAAAGLAVFLTGTGLYFSSRLVHTTSAVIANLMVPCVLWVLVPATVAAFVSLHQVPAQDKEFYMVLTGAVPIVLLTGIGLRVIWRRWTSTRAVIASLVLGCVLWGLGGTMMGALVETAFGVRSVVEWYMAMCPIVQGAAIADAFSRGWEGRHAWPLLNMQPLQSTAFVLMTTMMYTVAGLVFAWLAKARLRKRIF